MRELYGLFVQMEEHKDLSADPSEADQTLEPPATADVDKHGSEPFSRNETQLRQNSSMMNDT